MTKVVPKARELAGLKGYLTNLAACPDGTTVTAEFVISAYHQPVIEIHAGLHAITAADPLSDDLRDALAKINNAGQGAH